MTYKDRSKQLEYLRKYKKDRFIEIPPELKGDLRLKKEITNLINMALADLDYKKRKVSNPDSQEDKDPGHTKQSITEKARPGKGGKNGKPL